MATTSLSIVDYRGYMSGGYTTGESAGAGNGNFAGTGSYYSITQVSWGSVASSATKLGTLTFTTTLRKNSEATVSATAYLSTQGFSGSWDSSKVIAQSTKSVTFSGWSTTSVTFTFDVSGRSVSGETLYIWLGGSPLYHHFNSSSGSVSYTLKTYSVTYNANGGTGAPSTGAKTHGTTYTISSTKPTKASTTNTSTGSFVITGNANGGYFGSVSTQTTSITASTSRTDTINYTFSHWNTASNGSGTSYNSGASYTANAALTLYAQYTSSTTTGTTTYSNNKISGLATPSRNNTNPASYTVKFDGNGAPWAQSDKTIKTTRVWTFKGWATSASATSANAAASYTSATTVYAYWTYKDTLGTLTLPAAPSRPGYNFFGWATSASATSGAAANSTVSISSNVTYYAIWKPAGAIRVYVDDTKKYQMALVYLHDGTSWKQVVPYLYNPSSTTDTKPWKIVGG